MACNPLIPATCAVDAAGLIAGGAGDAVAGAVGNQFADAMRDGAAWVMETTMGWWIDVPAVDLVTSPAVTIRGYVLWLALAVATAGVMWQGILLMVSRRPDPFFAIGRGLFTLAFWAAVGIIGPAAALRAGDSFASWVLDEASSGQASERLLQLGSLTGVNSTGAVIVLGLLLMVSGLVQAVIMIFREGAVVVLAGVVVLASAGSFSAATRPWLHKVLGWMAALIAYKPAAALVYASAVAMVGEGNDARTLLAGLTMIVLAIFALPALMKFFTWTTGTVSSTGGGGAVAMLGVSAAAIHAAAALSSAGGSGGSAATQAAHLRQDLGPPTTPPASTGPSGAAPTPPAAAVTGSTPPAGASSTTAGAGAGAPTATGSSAAGGATASTAGPAAAAVLAVHAGTSAVQRGSAAAQHHLTGEANA